MIANAALVLKDTFTPRFTSIQSILDSLGFVLNYEIILAKFLSSCVYMLCLINVCPFDYKAFAVSGKVGIPLTAFNTPIEWMLSVAISIDRPKSVPQLNCNRSLHCSKIF